MEHLWNSADPFLYTYSKHSDRNASLVGYIIEQHARNKHMKYAVGVAFPGIIVHRVRMVALLQVLEYLLHENRQGVA